MSSILNKFKILTIGALVVSFFVCAVLTSCGSNKKDKNGGATESEHPGEGSEHPSDTTEHPSDSTKQEHPTNEEHPKK